jgi:NADPH:quinone reductase-like Zn-dependent oxidoreductase
METMRAARIDHFGGPEVIHIERIQRPEPGLGQVRIRVAAASVNPVDYKIRQGEFPVIGEEQLPLTLGRDIAGIVESVGQGVTHLHRGDRVFAMIGADGGYAEYALVKADYVVRVPVQLDLTHAAAVPLAAHTAWQALFDHGRLQAGEKVLIHGASGGVGHFAVQFAKARGATVYATGSGQALDFIRSLGADQVIDYKKQRFEDVCRDVDLVIDLIGGETQLRSWAVLRTGGRLVSTLTEPDSTSPQAQGKQGKRFMAQPDGAQLREIADLIATGKVRPAVNETFPLAEAAQAQRYLQESHVNGKVVLAIAS